LTTRVGSPMKSRMGKFLLHRIQALLDGRPHGPVTPGLEAAVYVHWLSLYESNPQKYLAVEEEVPSLRVELAAYFELTARTTAAHIELCESLHRGDTTAIGTRDFEAPEPDTEPPGRIARLNANFGLDWGLFYWDPTADGREPWGYRLYRATNHGKPELVLTCVESEALILEQPRRVSVRYHVTAFNGAGESELSPGFELIFDAPAEN
jgi:hypothetical protein